MSRKVTVPQLYALQLERIAANGLAADDIVAMLRRGSEAELAEKIDPEVKWDRLLGFAKDNWQAVETAVREGYRFPFITIGGIKNLLAIKFGKREGTDYRFQGDRIEELSLSSAEYNLLRSMIPLYWRFFSGDVVEQAERIRISIALQPQEELAVIVE
ncbi:hypothetical protein [Paenibacillus protaetiae]|uniref:Uncharacterized protein n=1 Tax=Paenibacillus protaetiae TaxID=2509456 RepID=A0A4P6F1N2_9BACL|nr:hypothetical protein [Paenibacillus protaetiae]QAY66957.1 hypothetical protein ET464_11690 [Paenibacillus protaetiae]